MKRGHQINNHYQDGLNNTFQEKYELRIQSFKKQVKIIKITMNNARCYWQILKEKSFGKI